MKNIFLVIVFFIGCAAFCQNDLTENEITKNESIIKVEPINDEQKNEIIKISDLTLNTTTTEIINPDCDYFKAENNDKDNSVKATKFSLVYLNDYAGNIDRVYFSLVKKAEIPSLRVELMCKADEGDLDKERCFDKSSKIEFILKNGVAISLLHIDDEECLQIDEKNQGAKKKMARLSGNFRFLIGNIQSLKESPIASMEITYSNEVLEYTVQKKVLLESDNATYEPANYFIKYLSCITN